MNYLMLVNKNNSLTKDYHPKNLVRVRIKTGGNIKIYLENKTYKQIKKLLKDMNNNFLSEAVVNSGYRPYLYQEMLLNDLIKKKGEMAYKRFARPGCSEHQTGLAVDIGFYKDGVYDEHFKVTDYLDEFKWIKENAHKYGFILRYPKGKEDITGYMYEPWHLRYIGDEASIIYKLNLTLEEYLEMFKN